MADHPLLRGRDDTELDLEAYEECRQRGQHRVELVMHVRRRPGPSLYLYRCVDCNAYIDGQGGKPINLEEPEP